MGCVALCYIFVVVVIVVMLFLPPCSVEPCFPMQLRNVCHCLYQVVSLRFPEGALISLGTLLFLRFINPSLGKYSWRWWNTEDNMILDIDLGYY